jgi:2-polyprenyl-3-methyl-5-hydroxy-6-metoxy-1,4-benzoquinol methylase
MNAYPSATFANFDVASGVPPNHEASYDLVIAGEVLEHVENAGAFLRGCGRLLQEHGVLCVSVPNACSPKIGLRAMVGRELVHPDHLVYYGPRTLARALKRAGFELTFLATYSAKPGPIGAVLRPLFELPARLFGAPTGEGLIAVACRASE